MKDMKYHFLPLLIVLLIAAGCNKVPLRGTVTFSDNDEPVPRGVVYFYTPKLAAQGAIQPDGTYVVGTDKKSDGLPRGTYQVYISGADDISYVQERPLGQIDPVTGNNIDDRYRTEVRKSLIHKKYTDFDTTPLTFTADGKQKKFDIKVERPAR